MNIVDWMLRFESLRGWPAVYGVIVTAVLLVLIRNQQLLTILLAVQYFFTSLLFIDVTEPSIALMKLITGFMVCLILYITWRQIIWEAPRNDVVQIGFLTVPKDAPLRLIVTSLIILALFILGQLPPTQIMNVPEELGYLNLVVYILGGVGVLTVSVTTEPFQAGIGILMLWLGLELFYATRAPSLPLLTTLVGINLLLVIGISFFIQRRYSSSI